MQNQNSKELTAAYKAQTLPDGWYYFSCAGTKPQIGKYVHPTVVAVAYAAQNGLDRPKPALYACQAYLSEPWTLLKFWHR